jgi:hypothetical protein
MEPSVTSTLRKRLLQRGRALLRGGGRAPVSLADLGRVERRELGLIHEALDRIERGRFGACGDCQRPIGLERLERAPWEPRCAGCQAEAGSVADAPA